MAAGASLDQCEGVVDDHLAFPLIAAEFFEGNRVGVADRDKGAGLNHKGGVFCKNAVAIRMNLLQTGKINLGEVADIAFPAREAGQVETAAQFLTAQCRDLLQSLQVSACSGFEDRVDLLIFGALEHIDVFVFQYQRQQVIGQRDAMRVKCGGEVTPGVDSFIFRGCAEQCIKFLDNGVGEQLTEDRQAVQPQTDCVFIVHLKIHPF